MTTSPSPPPPGAAAAAAAATTPSDEELSDDEEETPQLDEQSDDESVAPFTSLFARAKVLEQQVMQSPQQRNSLARPTENNAPVDPGRKMLKRSARPSSRSFRMSFFVTAGDDGLDDLVKNISGEGIDRRALLVRAALAVWEHHRAAAAMRRWKEILRVSSDSLLLLARSEDVNEEARRILLSAEATRAATENAAAAAPVSPRVAGLSHDVATPVKLARRDLDVLVVWARQMQAKTFPPGVDDTSIRETMKYLRFRQYEDGEALFFEGEIGEIFYFLFQGTVAVYVGSSASQRKAVEGTRRTARIQGKPDLAQLGKRVFAYRTGEGFGETAMFTHDAIRTASAVAVGACEVCELPKEVYKRTLKAFHQQFFTQAQKINFLQRVTLFRDWQRLRLTTVADILEKRKLAFGDHLLVEGSTVLSSCFFVLSGLVKLTKKVDMAPPPQPPSAADANLSSKKPKHRIQMSIELQTVGAAEIVALEALLEPNERAAYSAVAASASVELYVLKEVDARSVLGSTQSALHQRVRDMCIQERAARAARLAAARQTFHEHEALKRDAELLRSQDAFAERELAEQAARKALDAKADATLQATNTGASPLVAAGAAPYLPHLRATKLLEFAKTPFVPLSASSRVEHEALGVVASPRMLSMCAKNFVFENASTLASGYAEKLRLTFPPAPATDRSLVEKITALMTPVAPAAAATTTASPRSNATASPRCAARRIKPTSETRDAQRVLEQQMKRLPDLKTLGDRDLVVPSCTSPLGNATNNVVRQTPLHRDLRATQDAARRLVEEHLRKVSERRADTSGQATFLHFF